MITLMLLKLYHKSRLWISTNFSNFPSPICRSELGKGGVKIFRGPFAEELGFAITLAAANIAVEGDDNSKNAACNLSSVKIMHPPVEEMLHYYKR